MAESEFDARMRARRERVEAAKAKSVETLDEGARQKAEPIDDYWKLPKTGARTTLLNSAWTWTLISYVTIMAVVVLSIAQNELQILDQQSDFARMAIAIGLIYPAWRIGSMISRFLKKRGMGAGFSFSDAAKSTLNVPSSREKAAKPGSVEARMAARRARVEQARKDGKI